jgi:chemotaxis protein MotB
MARKKFDEEQDSHDRWLVSYADLVTLLFAFFVVMYAISSVNEAKYRVLADALGTAFGRSSKTAPLAPPSVEPGTPIRPKSLSREKRHSDAALRKEKEHMTGMARDILKALAPLVSQGKVRVTQTARGVNVEINASVLFATGDVKLTNESGQVLKAVALVLKNDDHDIQVEGHTDNIRISTPTFPSNWELSAVRASSVVRLFLDNGIAEGRLVAVGHGANRPIASNETADGRVRNRRVEVMILSALPEVVTEVPITAAPSR